MLGKYAAGHHVLAMTKVVRKGVAIASPLGYRRRVLQVIYFCVGRLPVLQGQIVSHESEFEWWCNEVEAFQFNRLSKL
jgi:hypothetical protein